MAFWWPLLVLALSYAICRLLFMLIPHNVPSIDVDVSDVLEDGSQMQENDFIYVPPRGRTQQLDPKVKCYEPATMKYLGYFPALTPAEVCDTPNDIRGAHIFYSILIALSIAMLFS